jgi:hypothetical protein
VLARVHLREIERGELLEELDEMGRQVTELLGQRGDAQAAIGAKIAAAREDLEKLEHERAEQHAVVAAAEESLAVAAAEARRLLAADPAHQALVEQARAAERVAEHAVSKAQEAHADRAAKGEPYEADALFAYLWERGYGTSRYRAAPVARLLDRWVARVARFEPLRRDYALLEELPGRFAEHARRMRARADEQTAVVRAGERAAAEAAGVPERERELAAAAEALAVVDRTIEHCEAQLDALVDERASFASGEDELSKRCTALLSDALRGERMRTLRARADRTPSADDDAAVDELTAIRAELPRLEDEAARYRALHGAQRERAAKLEELRKRFKERRYDSASSEFVNAELIATLLDQLVGGGLGVADIWDALDKQRRVHDLASAARSGSGRAPSGEPRRAARARR